MMSFACLIRRDTTFRIYKAIQQRKHHVRTLGTNVSKNGNLKFKSPHLDIIDGTTKKDRSEG